VNVGTSDHSTRMLPVTGAMLALTPWANITKIDS
jgi:hypothetical protein